MNRLFLLVLFVFAMAAAFTWFKLDQQVSVTLEYRAVSEESATKNKKVSRTDVAFPLSDSIKLDKKNPEHIYLELTALGSNQVGVLKLDFARGSLDVIVSESAVSEKRNVCLIDISDTEKVTSCSVLLKLTDGLPTRVIIVPKVHQVSVHGIDFESVTAKRHTEASSADLLAAFGVLLILGPVFVALRKFNGGEHLLLAAIGLSWIAYTGLSGLIYSLIFIVCGYGVIRLIDILENNKLRALVAALVGVALLVVFVKFLAPLVTTAFANPGGFALALPLGVSYFAIRIVDLLLTAYSGALKKINFLDYVAFMFMPHTLAAGPILTFSEFLSSRIENYSFVDFSAGFARMSFGVGKKLFADTFLLPVVSTSMGEFVVSGMSTSPIIVAKMLLINVLYVYLDFSAYSDLAIGAGRASGRRINENFNNPLIRSGIREYWRHWHMTLSNWVMRRVYLPAFLSSRSQTLSVISCMLVIGVWHTPNLSWSLWAVHHGIAMSAEGKYFPGSSLQRTGSARYLSRLGAIAFVWVWVALGHSFTLFSSVKFALTAYLLALEAPLDVLIGIVNIFILHR